MNHAYPVAAHKRRNPLDVEVWKMCDLITVDRIVENLNARIRREMNRRLKLEQEFGALSAAAKQVWDDLMIAHDHGEIKDVAEETVERLGSALFIKGRADQ